MQILVLYLRFDFGREYPVLDLAHQLDGLLRERKSENLYPVNEMSCKNYMSNLQYVAEYGQDGQSIPCIQPKFLQS